MLIDILILGGAIALLVCAQLLRVVMATPIPVLSARLASEDAEQQSGIQDLLAQARPTLTALGFVGPLWIEREYVPASVAEASLFAVFTQAGSGTSIWLSRPYDLSAPNALSTVVCTPLVDGRLAATQLGDPFLVAVGDPTLPAQVIARCSLGEALSKHHAFVARLGAVQDAGGVGPAALLWIAGERINAVRERLLGTGRLWLDGDVARPSWRFAFALLSAYFRRPKSLESRGRPIPAARLAVLAEIVDAVRNNVPPARVQLQLLLASSVLSLALGAWLFGLPLALTLLIVILLHESGHWLAMRLFGYRNTHVTLLPLLGGVAMGFENDPSAAKRAWVALAGPLPGIVLGWMLLVATTGVWQVAPAFTGIISMAVAILLIVNYLNVLPIPPLDGSHVLRALLPRNAPILQTIVLLAGVGVGVWVAAVLEMWVLAIIALLQLLFVPRLWASERVMKHVREAGMPAGSRAERRAWLLREMDAVLGAATVAKSRISQADDILSAIDLKPMGRSQGLLVGGVFAALLAVPVVGAGYYYVGTSVDAEGLARMEAQAGKEIELQGQVRGLALDSLVAAFATQTEKLSAPASESALAEAQARVQTRLPPDLVDVYRLANGSSVLGLASVEHLRRVADSPDAQTALGLVAEEEAIQVVLGDADIVRVSLADMASWVVLSAPESDLLLIGGPDPSSEKTGWCLIEFSGDFVQATQGARAWLEARWVSMQLSAYAEARSNERFTEAQRTLADRDVVELLDEFERPDLVQSLLVPDFRWPGPGSPKEIAALESRIGRLLPEDHRELLSVHDGFPPLQLFSVNDVRPWAQVAALRPQMLQLLLGAPFESSGATQDTLTEEQLGACWAIGGFAGHESVEDHYVPTILWCPERESAYLDLTARQSYSGLTDLIRYRAAQHAAF